MGDQKLIRCDNCGGFDPPHVDCSSVWIEEHSHPLAIDDLRPIRCDLVICQKCVRRLRRNLPATAQFGSSEDTK